MSEKLHLPDTRESIENSPARLLIDMCLDAYNSGQMTLEEASALFQRMISEEPQVAST